MARKTAKKKAKRKEKRKKKPNPANKRASHLETSQVVLNIVRTMGDKIIGVALAPGEKDLNKQT
jgi:hypothetical protein